MRVLSYSFKIFTIVGIWRPLNWSSGWRKILYNFYTVCIVMGLYTYVFMQFADLILSLTDISQFLERTFMFVSIMNSAIKIANMIKNRDKIINLLAILDSDFCRSRDEEENDIEAFNNYRIKINFSIFFSIIAFAVIAAIMSMIFTNVPERTLPFRVWVPYYNNSETVYWILYIQQSIIGHAFAASIAVANDTLISGLMILTCSQLQILKHRQENLPKIMQATEHKMDLNKNYSERLHLNQIIEYHKTILEFATGANDLFSSIIFIQYAISCFVLCVTVYRCAAMKITNPEYPFMIFYFFGMATQIFYYCWYGNEVILESVGIGESLYKMDWTQVNLSTQKDLIIIMNRTTHPIVFTSGKIIILSIDSFKGIMKLSYSAFNFLQNT